MLTLPLKLMAQQADTTFPYDAKLIVPVQERPRLFPLYPESGEGKYADIALQDSLGSIYYLNNTEHSLSMYQGGTLVWKCDFEKHPISFLVQTVGYISLSGNTIFLACHPCTATVNRKTGELQKGGCD